MPLCVLLSLFLFPFLLFFSVFFLQLFQRNKETKERGKGRHSTAARQNQHTVKLISWFASLQCLQEKAADQESVRDDSGRQSYEKASTHENGNFEGNSVVLVQNTVTSHHE